MMDQSGFKSKITQIQKKDSNAATIAFENFQKELKEHESKLIKEFNEKYSKCYKDPYFQEEDLDYGEYDSELSGSSLEVEQDDGAFISSLLDCGVDVNLANKRSSWEEEAVYGRLVEQQESMVWLSTE